MILTLVRIIKFSFQDIFRNIWLSLVTIIIMILALLTVNMLLIVKVIGQTAVGAIEDKIDINLFLKNNAEEDGIIDLKNRIASLSEVEDVIYISKEKALDDFKLAHENSPEIIDALLELENNPLAPSLVIKPKDLGSFDSLISNLYTIEDDIIESRNFTNYKEMLDKINTITDKVIDAALFLSLVFIFITILVIYNSVRVAIYTHKSEIAIMRLVGASNWFIQMPYLLSGIIYTLVGTAAVMLLFYPFLNLLQPYLETFFVGYNINMIDYFYGDITKTFGIQFLAGAGINIFASYLAVRKYSKV